MMRPPNLGRTSTHYCRRLSINAADAFKSNYKVNWSGDAIRKDIMQWMLETNIILGETMANISLDALDLVLLFWWFGVVLVVR
ncbi:hypothetical protein JHK87_022562 [Glycine soja]|nr:hypothetical protein JHK87_022562 [Glycine soja]